MTKLIYSRFRTGKCLMQKLEWENLECENCGEHMEVCGCNEFEEVKLCPKCGEKHMLIKKVRKEYGRQGGTVLPKEDKYEKFKEYIDGIAPHDCIRQIKILFDDFEEKQEEKNREREIEHIIAEEIYRKDYYHISIGQQGHVRLIYTKLKKGGYLK